jgi:hypothetical protein
MEKIASTFDRCQEAHFWLHMMEENYHAADPFRWQLNSFLRALKEIPQLLQMELQQGRQFKDWFANHKDRLNRDPLISALSKQRDLIVHRGMLVPHSRAFVGITEGRGLKLGIQFPLHPLEDSDHGMERYLRFVKAHNDFLGVLIPDEDSLPCVEREWRIPQFNDEVIDLCAQAWLRMATAVRDAMLWLGAEVPPLSLDCRHSSQQVRFKMYSREKLAEWMSRL